MANSRCVFVVFCICGLFSSCVANNQTRQVHIVYMGSLPGGDYAPAEHHLSILDQVLDSGFLAQSSLIRSYKRSFNGFAAYLTDQERQKISNYEEVVSVFPSRILQPQTTRSWDFMGFPENVRRHSSIESNVIIGVIDTGIWPESESFSDKNIGPVPTKWKGACKGGKNFTCNKKLIGARFYILNDSVRDTVGHGTHTASIAAGNHVKGASFYGLAQGTARGGVPSARIAAYNVCTPLGCPDDSLLAAFDDAIADGVDIITISIGPNKPERFEKDPIAIGAFHAMEKNILTVTAAGNDGNSSGTVEAVAPWMLVVAASNIDRKITDKVVLGNGKTLVGIAVNSFNFNGSYFPLITGRDGSKICHGIMAAQCYSGCLDKELVKGKIVVCNGTADGLAEAFRVGALGSIVPNDAEHNYSAVLPLPASVMSAQDISLMKAYVKSTKNPLANILKSEEIHDSEAPIVNYFSSRGPNRIIPEILKPDLSAPGVGILAAYPAAVSPSGLDEIPKRSVKYNILSGTSMATPHVAGAAAYVKSFHPTWSSSAIQSSLITTAKQMDASKNPDAEFAYGAGHLDPVKAASPGLVYETSKYDYIKMLCTIGFNNSKIRIIAGGNATCPAGEKLTPKDINYPSMTAYVAGNRAFTVSFLRTVTNVGLANSTYKASIINRSQLNITVKPDILSFGSLNEKKSFRIIVNGKGLQLERYCMKSASLVWSDGLHNVRSPIVVYTS
ncbi:Subtilisin-like protease [Heracleum sosnowskyi]|uniref:Subtilisin-like protease n=1 Tax=Heracleum sosnowskyi TaxID=360622 RepID=A0AAD8MNH1_9APIA|nr:Subtilisin-like protease [Heracleum sosnowskyi]